MWFQSHVKTSALAHRMDTVEIHMHCHVIVQAGNLKFPIHFPVELLLMQCVYIHWAHSLSMICRHNAILSTCFYACKGDDRNIVRRFVAGQELLI